MNNDITIIKTISQRKISWKRASRRAYPRWSAARGRSELRVIEQQVFEILLAFAGGAQLLEKHHLNDSRSSFLRWHYLWLYLSHVGHCLGALLSQWARGGVLRTHQKNSPENYLLGDCYIDLALGGRWLSNMAYVVCHSAQYPLSQRLEEVSVFEFGRLRVFALVGFNFAQPLLMVQILQQHQQNSAFNWRANEIRLLTSSHSFLQWDFQFFRVMCVANSLCFVCFLISWGKYTTSNKFQWSSEIKRPSHFWLKLRIEQRTIPGQLQWRCPSKSF